MTTKQTLRRRRGRAIRKARRIARDINVDPQFLAQCIELIRSRIRLAIETLVQAAASIWQTICVAVLRGSPLLLTPRAGTRRQLLHNGRKP